MSTTGCSVGPLCTADAAASTAQAVVVVFARLPVPGKVKTRLAAGVGSEHAAAFYKLCAEHVAQEVIRCHDVDGVVFCAAAEDVEGVAAWLQAAGAPLPVRAQVQDADLGRRMITALTAAATGAEMPAGAAVTTSFDISHLSYSPQQQTQQQVQDAPAQHVPGCTVLSAAPKHRYDIAIVVGTDIPDLSSEVLSAAVAALRQSGKPGGTAVPDMLLGPAADGGYYLLGFATETLLRPDVQDCSVFAGVEWSCASVLERTVAAARKLGINVVPSEALPTLQDIDTKQDAARWLKGSEQAAAVQQRLFQQSTFRQMRELLQDCAE